MSVVAQMVLLAVMVHVAGITDDQPYCAPRYHRLCRGKGLHVGCRYPDPRPGPLCQNYSPIKFQDKLKHFIIHYINRRRQRIAAGNERVRGGLHLPKPNIMMMVEWDRELAVLAQRLADQCSFVHDDCRATVRFPYAGQTVGEVRWRRSSAPDELTAQRAIRRVFDAWWGEKRRVQPEQLTAPFRLTAKGSIWGHFSQLAVWTLRAVGCGAVRHGVSAPRLLLVCDFSHTNMLGQRTLSPGSLGLCPLNTARRPRSSYPLLCAPVRSQTKIEQYQYEQDAEQDLSTVEDYVNIPTRTYTLLWNTTSPTLLKASQQTKAITRERHTIMDEGKTDYVFQVAILRNQSSKSTILDKLDMESEVRKKVKNKNHYDDEHFWRPRPTDWSPSDYHVADEDTVTRRQTENSQWSSNKNDERDSVRRSTAISIPIQSYVARHKWHQTRDRPKRPGASALINIPTIVRTRRRPVVSLMLDKEDIDQLFKDTGFNPNWMRKQPNA